MYIIKKLNALVLQTMTWAEPKFDMFHVLYGNLAVLGVITWRMPGIAICGILGT